MMTKACQVVHIFSCVIHLDVVVRAAVCICIFGTDNFTFLDADGIACRVETAKCYIVIIVLCEVNLQFSTKSLTSECPQFVFQWFCSITIHAKCRYCMVDTKQFVPDGLQRTA